MSTDESWSLLRAALAGAQPGSLLLLDEQFGGGLPVPESLTAISNRCDVAEAVSAQGVNCLLNDFDFSALNFSPSQIYYRISKEKQLVNHLLDSALHALAPGGELVLAGYKNEGIRTFVKKAAQISSAAVAEKKGNRSSWLARLKPATTPTALLGDGEYATLRELQPDIGNTYCSKPGVFGWNKVDIGSALLATQLARFFSEKPVAKLLDLGCGYGYLSIAAAALSSAHITATDNNVAAVTACRANFARFNISGEVVLADCAKGIETQFDAVLCNPPFHRGFAVEIEIIDRFLALAAARLAPTGRALFVVHRTVNPGSRAGHSFNEVRVVAETPQFQVVELAAPKRAPGQSRA